MHGRGLLQLVRNHPLRAPTHQSTRRPTTGDVLPRSPPSLLHHTTTNALTRVTTIHQLPKHEDCVAIHNATIHLRILPVLSQHPDTTRHGRSNRQTQHPPLSLHDLLRSLRTCCMHTRRRAQSRLAYCPRTRFTAQSRRGVRQSRVRYQGASSGEPAVDKCVDGYANFPRAGAGARGHEDGVWGWR